MASRKTHTKRPERRFFIEGIRRGQPDIHRLGKVLLAVALAEQQRSAEISEGTQGGAG